MSESWDTLHRPGQATLHWTTDNLGEAAPGVLTPLTWSVWGPIGDSHAREVAYQLGALTRRERTPATGGAGVAEIFFGRMALQLEYLSTIGDRMPGTTGRATVEGLVGQAPSDMNYQPTRRRYLSVAWRLPKAFLTAPGAVRRMTGPTDTWWRRGIATLPGLDRPQAVALLEEAVDRFETTLRTHSLCLLSVIQPLHEALSRLVAWAGVGEVAALSGSGGAEMAIVADMWQLSRGELTLEQVVGNHGFHGPLEGELSSRVWREDPAPLVRLVEHYAARVDDESPAERAQRAARRLPGLQRAVLAALPAYQRPAAGLLLRLAAARLPLRGVGKRAFLQCFDLARGAARRLGVLLVESGELDHEDDVFYLTRDELGGALPPHARKLVARRRARRALYKTFTLPSTWTGTVEPIAAGSAGGASEEITVVEGVGTSPGVVEGIVRVVNDPATVEVEDGEILVAFTTDPSWSSVMFVSSALVVDIGGMLSHAAVVARELGLPCVVNTRVGTQVLRTGDRVRVDGSAGTVEILERTSTNSAPPTTTT